MVVIFIFFEETRFLSKERNDDPAAERSPKEEPIIRVHSDVSPIPRKPLLQRLKPWSGIHPTTMYLTFFVRPWPLLAYPAVLYSFLTFAASASWSICFLDTYASVFQRPPYSMSPGISSLIYIAAIIGMTIGSYIGGPLTDRLAEWYARKHNGVFEPEIRLVVMFVPFLIVPAGLLM